MPGVKGRARQCRTLLTALLLSALLVLASGPGFHTRADLDRHYRKHGAEFGHISESQYLHLAQQLRDAPAGRDILQSVKPYGVITRFDRRHGYFGAYNSDGTIRTFFIPVDGERYFHRQAHRTND